MMLELVLECEVGTIMRYLGQFPEEDEVVDVILRHMEDDDPSFAFRCCSRKTVYSPAAKASKPNV